MLTVRKCSSLSITTDTAAGHSQAPDQRTPAPCSHPPEKYIRLSSARAAAGPSTVCTLYNIIIVALIIARTRDPPQADGRGGGEGEGGGGAALLSMLRVTARTFTRDWCWYIT